MTLLQKLLELQKILEKGKEINKNSLEMFKNFQELVDDCIADKMIISLTPDNEIYLTWEDDKKHCFCFKENGFIRYFVLRNK